MADETRVPAADLQEFTKGVFIAGPVEGMALIERLPDVEGVIVSSTNQVLVSSGLRDRLIRIADPTDAP